MTSKPKIVPLGDSVLSVQLGDEIEPITNRRVHALAAVIDQSPLEGVIENVPAYTTLVIHYDPLRLTFKDLREWVYIQLDQIDTAGVRTPRLIDVPVEYGGEYGIDLAYIAAARHLDVEDVIRIHSGKTYTVYMMGFTPGFPYMGKLDDSIATPRLETPRTRVPAGSVAIAGSQTGIYPTDSPGGWRLIGHTSLKLVDFTVEIPFLFSPGDEVRFLPSQNDT